MYLQDGNIPLMHFTYFSPLLSNSPLTISYTNQYTAIYTIRLSPWTDEYWTFFIIEVFLFFNYHTFSISIRFFWRKLFFIPLSKACSTFIIIYWFQDSFSEILKVFEWHWFHFDLYHGSFFVKYILYQIVHEASLRTSKNWFFVVQLT